MEDRSLIIKPAAHFSSFNIYTNLLLSPSWLTHVVVKEVEAFRLATPTASLWQPHSVRQGNRLNKEDGASWGIGWQ